ncbi:MAG: ADP-ribosylation factor-like protein [Candidatus Hodarchaeales archaeon]
MIRFSILARGGIEIFNYETEEMDNQLIDQHSGFMTAIQLFSETLENPIQQVMFSNMHLYVRTYGDFALQLMLKGRMDDHDIQDLFDKLSKATIKLLEGQQPGIYPQRKVFMEHLLPILSLIKYPSPELVIQEVKEKETIYRIALVGLAKAGKTSIVRVFFDNWSLELVKNIKPTIGVELEQKFQHFLKHNLVVADFGGQKAFCKKHLTREELWKNISALIFVVDLQNPSLFKDAGEYLTKVWKIVTRVNKKIPRLAVFLHKFDLDKREELEKSIAPCLVEFKDFIDFASFHFTTIEDSSCNIAMIKSLYFSLPDIMLKKLIEEEFIDYLEQKILPLYSILAQSNDFNEVFQESEVAIRKSTVIHGMNLGLLLQESWLKYLMGEWKPKSRLLKSKSIKFVQKGNQLNITIPNWVSSGFPEELTTTLIDGLLEGILKAFDMEISGKTKDNMGNITWVIRKHAYLMTIIKLQYFFRYST